MKDRAVREVFNEMADISSSLLFSSRRTQDKTPIQQNIWTWTSAAEIRHRQVQKCRLFIL